MDLSWYPWLKCFITTKVAKSVFSKLEYKKEKSSRHKSYLLSIFVGAWSSKNVTSTLLHRFSSQKAAFQFRKCDLSFHNKSKSNKYRTCKTIICCLIYVYKIFTYTKSVLFFYEHCTCIEKWTVASCSSDLFDYRTGSIQSILLKWNSFCTKIIIKVKVIIVMYL